MRFDMARHLAHFMREGSAPGTMGVLCTAVVEKETAKGVERVATPPAEFSWPDYLTFLLYIDAEIEHGLMIQYLYAAYSLGGPQVPLAHRDRIRGWQEVILGIAKEEMGHLISVQNVLTLIGAPLNFGREDFPWDTDFYPFPFSLEPLSLESLASYVFAESPENFSGQDADEIERLLRKVTSDPHKVSALFAEIFEIIQDPERIPDDIFQPHTWPYQANWDQWGRGYQGGRRGNTTGANPPASPNLLVKPVASRNDAIASLKAIAEQGEVPVGESAADPSHFARFLKIFKEMKDLEPIYELEGWTPARNIAFNPYIRQTGQPPSNGACKDVPRDAITNEYAATWAQLFNVRYRLLLTLMVHGYDLSAGAGDEGPTGPLAMLINATFGEMYNLRAIASMLVELPLDHDPKGKHAGPPFQLPYTLSRPSGGLNRWREHREILRAADSLIDRLMKEVPSAGHQYLHSLREADQKLLQVINMMASIRS